ncbi:MAG: hypothetical protein WC260_01025 [Candidatus Pacearchaeota archaeon]
MKNKFILTMDFVVIIGTLFGLMWIIGYSTPRVISPIDNYETTSSNVLFSIENADYLFIDKDINFTNPIEVNLKNNSQIQLEPGIYYWKAIGVRQTEIRTLTINTLVSLRLDKTESGFNVVNSGNVNLNVEVYNNSELIDEIYLESGGKINELGDKFIGGMK